jgi:hypothetical protein
LWLPVSAGRWQQRELKDGTYTMDDLLDFHEYYSIDRENEQRFNEWQADQREDG